MNPFSFTQEISLMFHWENKPLTFKLLTSKGYRRLEDDGSSKKKKRVKWSDTVPQIDSQPCGILNK